MSASIASDTPTVFDVDIIRQDFPILKKTVRGKPLIYFDNAATSQKPQPVIDTLERYYSNENANIHRGIHALSEQATESYEAARDKVRDFLNAGKRESIVFVRGATEGINLVAQSYGRSRLQAGDEIIISAMEHHSNIVPWQIVCEQTGAVLKVIPMNDDGELVMDAYQNLLNPKTKIVSLVHISNALGTINPIKSMIDLAHQYDAVVMVDGAQAVPHVAVDVRALDCDFYVFSGHKVFAPLGIGVLYGKPSLLDAMPPWQGGGDMIKMVSFEKTLYNDLPYKFEAGTPHISGVIGLGAALTYFHHLNLDEIVDYEHQLLNYATAKIGAIDKVKLIGTARHKVSILSFVMNVHPHDIGTFLDNEGIAIRAGHHCAMPIMSYFNVPATARASFAFYNTRDEVDRLAEVLAKTAKFFK